MKSNKDNFYGFNKSTLDSFENFESWMNGNLGISYWDSDNGLLELIYNKLKDEQTDVKTLIKFDKAIDELHDIQKPITDSIMQNKIYTTDFNNLDELSENIETFTNHYNDVAFKNATPDQDILGFDYEEYKSYEGWVDDPEYYYELACPSHDTIYKDALYWYPNIPDSLADGEYIRLNDYQDGFDQAKEYDLLDWAIEENSNNVLDVLIPKLEIKKPSQTM